MTLPSNPKIGVSVALLNDRDEVLMGKRIGFGEGVWSFTGGKLEFKHGESVADCAYREVLEETGIAMDTKSLYPSQWTVGRLDPSFIVLYLICTKWSGKPINREPDKCSGWQWFNVLDKLPQPNWICPMMLTELEHYCNRDGV